MKTIFTYPILRAFAITIVVLVSNLASTGQATHPVSVTDGSFTPKELTITAGDKVIWTNNGANGHNVNGAKAIFPSNPESFGNEVSLGWTYEFDFHTAGTYNYQCDPHVEYGMTGKVIVNPKPDGPLKLTVNFTGMTPHVGQTLWLAVIDKATHSEIGRVEKSIDAAAFSIEVPGIEIGKSYHVDFFADHNKNGVYDPSPTDHAWRLQLDNVAGNSVLDFAHNTTFTDIAWTNKLTVHFSGMTPHVGQMLMLFLKQADTNLYVDTIVVDPIPGATFDVNFYKIMPGMSYKVDFYSDHNKNGIYDAPPADHAWRIKLDGVKGDSIVNFAHNTIFTDIFGPASHHITVSNGKFTPKEQTISVGDTVIWTNIQGNHNVNGTQATFPSNPESFGNAVATDWTYKYVFNTAGTYNYQCDPHADFGMVGKIIVTPQPGTGPYNLTVNFTGMTPHVGQTLWLAVIDKATHSEIGRVEKSIDAAAFSIEVPGIEMGKSYQVDFFADHNKNGVYDPSPADHAWRLQLDNVAGNSALDFAHNTTFTDIAWKYRLTVRFAGMTPHVGQKMTLFLIWADTGFYHDTLVVPSVPAAAFDVNSYEIKPGFNYSINFYADHNNNGVYDSPPTDHAWHLFLDQVKGDTIINFAHNTNFTDILPTSVDEIDGYQEPRLYPIPASDYVELSLPPNYAPVRSVIVYSIAGSVIETKTFSEVAGQIRYNLSRFKSGVYFMEINTGKRKDVLKFIKQ